MNLTLRIKDEDFSPFAGFGSNFNQELNFYLNMFESNDNFTCLKIESKTGNLDLAKISFIQHCLSYKKNNFIMFTNVDFNINGRPERYYLIITKVPKEDLN